MGSASITYWQRIEPRPRSPIIKRALAAEVHDPLWFLTRQWQLGEFHGEDAGSPSAVEALVTTSKLRARKVGTTWDTAFDASSAEVEVSREGLDPTDLTTSVELGVEFESALRGSALIEQDISALRAALPPLATPAEDDDEGNAFSLIAAPRISNGFFVVTDQAGFEAIVNGMSGFSAQTKTAAIAAGVAVRASATARYGTISTGAPADWLSERLRFEAEIAGERPDGTAVAFDVQVGPRGEIDWYALDAETAVPTLPGPPSTPTTRTIRALPSAVQFRGMPNARFWDLESATTDFGDVRTDKRDLARAVAMEFMFVQGNDWFLLPVELEVGSLSSLSYLVVHDVFGGLTVVDPANELHPDATHPDWNMFSTEIADGTRAPYFHLSATLGGAKQDGPVLEEARFVRDEMANLAWAIEHTTPNALGLRFSSHERAVATLPTAPQPPVTPDPEVPLKYVMQTEVPPHWYPFFPVALTGGNGQVGLVRGEVIATEVAHFRTSPPDGAIISAFGKGLDVLREEEVPRSGTIVQRRFCRTRLPNGSTVTWISRFRSQGVGEASSGLRFDLAIPKGS